MQQDFIKGVRIECDRVEKTITFTHDGPLGRYICITRRNNAVKGKVCHSLTLNGQPILGDTPQSQEWAIRAVRFRAAPFIKGWLRELDYGQQMSRKRLARFEEKLQEVATL